MPKLSGVERAERTLDVVNGHKLPFARKPGLCQLFPWVISDLDAEQDVYSSSATTM